MRKEVITCILFSLWAVPCLSMDIGIDFEFVNNLNYVKGYRTKDGAITRTTDIPTSSSGTYAGNFTWYTDGSFANQYAYVSKNLPGSFDFTSASLSFYHKRTNRSNLVGIALYDNGNLVEQWLWTVSTSWTQIQATVGNSSGAYEHITGSGSITGVDEIRFIHKNTQNPGSGLAHTVYFDDFEATNVLQPEGRLDFEKVDDLDYIQGYLTKDGDISLSDDDAEGGIDDKHSTQFTWYTDGTAAGQYAYMKKEMSGNFDFTSAKLVFYAKRTNRSDQVGIAIYDNGTLIEEWLWPSSDTWTAYTANIGSSSGATVHNVGTGNIMSVDEIRFIHKNTGAPGSGLAHTVLFDNCYMLGVKRPDVCIDFENIFHLSYVAGYLTKDGSISQIANVPSSSIGQYAANFTWYTDGSVANQYAYMTKNLPGIHDFSFATFVFSHKRTNRSTHVGVALYDSQGNMVEEWLWPYSSIWTTQQITVGQQSGATVHNTGSGDVSAVTQIRFIHKNTSNPGSGLAHTVYFDDFAAYGVTRPIRYGYWDHEFGPNSGTDFLDYVNVGKSLSVSSAASIANQGIPVVIFIGGFNAAMTRTEWRTRLSEKAADIRAIGATNVAYVHLMDEPYGAGFSQTQLEQIIEDARELIDDESNTFRYGITFPSSTIAIGTDVIPGNLDVIGLNHYPFRVTDPAWVLAAEEKTFYYRTEDMVLRVKSQLPPACSIYMVGQGFEGDSRWRTPPTGSAQWYANWVAEDLNFGGLLWFTWADRDYLTGSESITGLPAAQEAVGNDFFGL